MNKTIIFRPNETDGFSEGDEYPITMPLEHPRKTIGKATVRRDEDGSLICECAFNDTPEAKKLVEIITKACIGFSPIGDTCPECGHVGPRKIMEFDLDEIRVCEKCNAREIFRTR